MSLYSSSESALEDSNSMATAWGVNIVGKGQRRRCCRRFFDYRGLSAAILEYPFKDSGKETDPLKTWVRNVEVA